MCVEYLQGRSTNLLQFISLEQSSRLDEYCECRGSAGKFVTLVFFVIPKSVDSNANLGYQENRSMKENSHIINT